MSWFDDLSNLLTRKLDKDFQPFHSAMERIYDYVHAKSFGRCVSKKIKHAEKREKMILELFEAYAAEKPLNEICSCRFMRKISKHNQDNDENLAYIEHRVAPAQVGKIANALLEETAVVRWMVEFDRTIMDPVTAAQQWKILNSIPEEENAKLMRSRTVIGAHLAEAALVTRVINIAEIDQIIEALENFAWRKKEYKEVIPLIEDLLSREREKKEFSPKEIEQILGMISDTKEKSPKNSDDDEIQFVLEMSERREGEIPKELCLPFFIACYTALIHSGGAYRDQFKKSLIEGLNNFKRDPSLPKAKES